MLVFWLDHKTVVFGRFRKVRSAISAILVCEVREPPTPIGCVRRENDCRLFIQRIRSKRGSYNVTEVTEIAWQLHPQLMVWMASSLNTLPLNIPWNLWMKRFVGVFNGHSHAWMTLRASKSTRKQIISARDWTILNPIKLITYYLTKSSGL